MCSDVSEMLSNSEPPFVADTQENLDGWHNIRLPSMVMFVSQDASAHLTLINAVSQLDELRVNHATAHQATTMSNSGCVDAPITSL